MFQASKKHGVFALFFLSLFTFPGVSQAKAPVSKPVKKKESFFRKYAKTRGFRLGKPRQIRFCKDSSEVFFLRSVHSRSSIQNLYVYDLKTKKEKVLLTAKQVLQGAAEKLSKEEKALRERMRMRARGIARFYLSPDHKTIMVPLSGRLFLIDRQSKKVVEVKSSRGFPNRPKFSPNGRYISTVRKGNVFFYDRNLKKEVQLTKNQRTSVTLGLAEFVAQEEMGRYNGYWWAPTSDALVIQETDNRKVEKLYIMDPSRPNKKPVSFSYPRAGKRNAKTRLAVMSLDGMRRVWLQWNRKKYPYIVRVSWQKHAPLTLVVQNREQTEVAILVASPLTGKTKCIFVEKDKAWLNIDRSFPTWLEKGKSFLWKSERSGFAQVELRDNQGKLLRVVTPKNIGFVRLLHVARKANKLFFTGSSDPTQRHIFSASLQVTKQKVVSKLTKEVGVHFASFSSDGKHFVLSSYFPNKASKKVLKATSTGEVVGSLRDLSETSPLVPKPQWVTVGKRKLRAVVVRPQNFQKGKKYPVVLHVYGGPLAQMVRRARNWYVRSQWIANRGVIVVSIDGRGTPGRGRDWERSIKYDFVNLALQDQVDGLQALAKRFPEIDATRVGIEGWSFGGYMSVMAVLRRPDIFRVGVAGAPVTDWLDYDTHYTERYLGLPKKHPAAYKKSSVLTYAKQLKRPLLLVHGTADDNVYFSHSLKLANAFFFAGKRFDFLPLNRQTHMVRGARRKELLYKKTIDYLLKHLQKAK